MIGPELKLAIACCRWSWSEPPPGEPVQLASGVDWRKFLQVIERHRLQGIAAKAIRDNGIELPPDIAKELSAAAIEVGASNLRAAAEARRVADAFAAAAIPILFVKGLTLSALAYGDPFIKASCDIDILVEPRNLEPAAQLLGGLGYRPTAPAVHPSSAQLSEWHGRLKESVWESADSGVVVELHTGLADNPVLIPGIGIGAPSRMVPVEGVGALPTLNTQDLFAYLCVHGSSSAWFRLKWIADLAAFVHQPGAEDLADLYAAAVSKGAGRAPAQALLLADRLSLLSLPEDLRRQISRDPVNRLLAGMALRLLVRGKAPTERRLGTASIHLSQPLLLRGIRFKGAELLRQVRELSYRKWGVRG